MLQRGPQTKVRLHPCFKEAAEVEGTAGIYPCLSSSTQLLDLL